MIVLEVAGGIILAVVVIGFALNWIDDYNRYWS
jgi:hypothetical protein